MPSSDPLATAPLLAFATTYMLLAVLPGPNFLVVAQASLSPRPRAGILAAAGIAAGAGFLALLTLSLAARLAPDPVLAAAGHAGFALLLLLAGGRTLARLARPVLSAAAPLPPARPAGGGVFLLAFATAAANPLSAAFFGSYLVASRSDGGTGFDAAAGATAVFLVAVLWFGALALLLSMAPCRAFLGRHRDRLDGLIALALLLAGAGMLARLLPAT
jgi:threonine/homoserine/homoserine lactone efflux protein